MRRILPVLLSLLPAVCLSLSAQQAPVLTHLESGSCSACKVTVEYVTTIGSESDPEPLTEYGELLPLPDGSYLARLAMTKIQLLHFDARGKYLGTVGTLGDGPGEYRYVQTVTVARGDSIAILGNSRLTVISIKSGKGHSETLASGTEGFHEVVYPDGRLLLNVMSQHQRAFALFSPAGALLQRFGAEQPPLVLPHQNGRTIGDEYANQYVLTRSKAGGTWAVSTWYSHRVQRVGDDGKQLNDIQRKPAWYPPYTYIDIDEKMYRLGELRAPALPVVKGAGVDASGHLLVISRVADAHWQKDPKVSPPPKPGLEYSVEKLDATGGIARYVDGILELYDDKTGTFMGSWRSDTPLGAPMANGMLYTWDAGGDGVVVKVWRVRVG